MNVTEHASGDVNTPRGGMKPLSTGLTSDVLPEVQKPVLAENSQTGVSTRNALFHWYALRTTYGREKKAYEYLVKQKVEVFYPTITTVKLVDGKKRSVEESRLPNILFAYGTFDDIKTYVYDNVNLPYLRFYYRHFHVGNRAAKEPLIVPDNQIKSLKIICASETGDVIFVPADVQKFKVGQLVRIIDGNFKGVEGRVARYQGQQRVAVVIDGLLTVATAYVPTAFLENIV